ncbi:MAG: site-specific integrase [Acidobacteriia bacterium]|nr:site-specific integrase [Terriglobia bacterium]
MNEEAEPMPDKVGHRRRYGKGAFEKYPGVWYARYVDATGRRRVEKAGSKSAALNLYRRRKDEILQGKLFPENRRKGVKFSDIAQDAINRAKESGRHPGKLALVADWFSNRNAADITPQDIERELNRLRHRGHRFKEHGLAQSTLNRFRAAASAIFKLAMQDNKVLANPARLVSTKKENNERVRYLTEDEESRVRSKIRELSPEREPEFDIALHTGIRKGEQYSLRWDDVDLINGILTVVKGKGNKKRHVPLNSDAMAALAKLKGRGDNSGLVCPGGMGKDGYWATYDWFDEAVAAGGVNDFTWHDLRHTFASRLRMKGVELPTIKDLLGHTTINMVLRYAHLAPGYLRKAVEAIATTPVDREVVPQEVTVQ